jgi:predicted alpha/beta-fold hydrolase
MQDPGATWTVDLADGDQLVCRLSEGPSDFIVLLCHGLTGNADAGYNHRLGRLFQKEGHTVCRMNHRNCGEGFGRAKHPYHAGRSDDLGRIVFELKKLYPRKKVVLIAFSMSGNAALLLSSGVIPSSRVFDPISFAKQAAEQGWATPDFSIVVNPPVNLSQTADRFLIKFNRVYQWNFIRSLKKMVRDLQRHQRLAVDIDVSTWMTIRQFDEIFTAARSGFASAEHYYKTCQAIGYLKQAWVPTYILAAKDDPFIDYRELEQSKKSDSIQVQFVEKGGHMGYLHRHKTPLDDHRWMDYAVHQLFNNLALSS